MSFYRTCPHCDSNLDPGERCDCQKPEQRIAEILKQQNPLHDLMAKEKPTAATVSNAGDLMQDSGQRKTQYLRPLAPHFYKLEDI